MLRTGTSNKQIENETNFTISKSGKNICFKFNQTANILIKVFDITGRLIKFIVEKSGTSIDLNLATGFYMVEYILDGISGIEKFMVE